jgi:hypothetical protein
MGTSLSATNKLLLLERLVPSCVSRANIPEEYRSLIIPAADRYYRQDREVEMLSQNINFGPLSLWAHDILAKQDIMLCTLMPSHMLALHALFEDSLHLENPEAPSYLLEEKEYNLFNLPGGKYRIPIAKGKKVLSVCINVEPDVLKSLVEEFPGLAPLAGKEAKAPGALNKYPYLSNPICDFLVEKLLSCKYDTKRAFPFMFRICIDLMRNMAAQEAAAHQRLMSDTLLNADKIHSLFAYLRDYPFKKHTITQLGFMFETSGKELAFEFKQHFAVNIHDFMHMSRMMLIYDMMQQAVVPMEEIARITEFPNVLNMMMQVSDYYSCNRTSTYQ